MTSMSIKSLQSVFSASHRHYASASWIKMPCIKGSAGALGAVCMAQKEKEEKKRRKNFGTCIHLRLAAKTQDLTPCGWRLSSCLRREEESGGRMGSNVMAPLWICSFSHLVLFHWSLLLYLNPHLVLVYHPSSRFTLANCISSLESHECSSRNIFMEPYQICWPALFRGRSLQQSRKPMVSRRSGFLTSGLLSPAGLAHWRE